MNSDSGNLLRDDYLEKCFENLGNIKNNSNDVNHRVFSFGTVVNVRLSGWWYTSAATYFSRVSGKNVHQDAGHIFLRARQLRNKRALEPSHTKCHMPARASVLIPKYPAKRIKLCQIAI